MDAEERAVLEAEISDHCRRSDYERATTVAIEGYGPELLGFLTALLRDENDACDAFSQLCEDIWRGLDRFEHRSSFRTWAYMLARNAVLRLRRTDQRYRKRVAPLNDSDQLSRVEQKVRTSTLPFLRSQSKNRLAELRLTLPDEDQALLILRVDRDLGWNEIAQVMAESPLEGEALQREAARLRKRFQLVKDELREKARAAGLLDDA